MTMTTDRVKLSEIGEANVPDVRTEVPGPRSRAHWDRDQRYRIANSSPGAAALRIVIEDAAGALIRDIDGNVFVDLASGQVVTNVGHCPPEVVDALRDELGKFMHFGDFPTPIRAEFFDALARTLPESLRTFHMYTTGSEAVESAIRMAKSFTGRYEVISFYDAFHGRTLGAMSLMGLPLKHGMGPFAPGSHMSQNAYRYRCQFCSARESCTLECARAIEHVYAQSTERRLAAVIIEPVQGAGGVIPHPAEFLQYLRAFCDRVGALLIIDEVLTGAGRTGTMWAFEQAGVLPDILVAGKGLGSGYPISVVASRRDVAEAPPFGQPGGGGSTFGGSNLASAAGLATLRLLEDGTVLENARRVGAIIGDALRDMQERHALIGDVRGVGMLWGAELVKDRATKERAGPETVRALQNACAKRGVLVLAIGPTVRIAPPLILSEALAQRSLALLDEAFAEIGSAS